MSNSDYQEASQTAINGPDDEILVTVIIERHVYNGWIERSVEQASNDNQRWFIGEIIFVQQKDGTPGTLYVHDLADAARSTFPDQNDDFYRNMTPTQKAFIIEEMKIKPSPFDAKFFCTRLPNFKAWNGAKPEVCHGFNPSEDIDSDDLSMLRILNDLYKRSSIETVVVTFLANATINAMTTLTINETLRHFILLGVLNLEKIKIAKTGTSKKIVPVLEAITHQSQVTEEEDLRNDLEDYI